MIQLSLMPEDLEDEAGKGKAPCARFNGTYLYLGTRRERYGSNARLYLSEQDREAISALLGDDGYAFTLLEGQQAAVLRSGGHRRLNKSPKNSRWSISLANRAIKEKLDRMFPGEASVEAVIEPVMLGGAA